ncbi:MAG: 3-phosphoshikimate 1-carboxyvinyltransferase [Acidobacteriota bacterium]
MIKISPVTKCEGMLIPPPDKSISHRALLLGAVAFGKSEIINLSSADDVQTTQKALMTLGKKIYDTKSSVTIEGKGFSEGKECTIDCRNSGTTARMIMGLLAPEKVFIRIIGDDSLTNRPMERVISPLKRMGASITYLDRFGYLPVNLKGQDLHGVRYKLPVPSAQVKSALLLAGLKAKGGTTIIEPRPTRDHTERMLNMMEADILIKRSDSGSEIRINPSELSNFKMKIPGDFSSAAYFMALAALCPGKGLTISDVNLNPTRLGFLEALRAMGMSIRMDLDDVTPEPVGKIFINGGSLNAVVIDADKVPYMIDEVPLLAVVATQAKGKTIIRGAEELRMKEADRIGSLVEGLIKMGASIEATEDGFIIEGPTLLKGATLNPHGDHRLAMCFTVAASIANSDSIIKNEECVSISYPVFYQDFNRLTLL